MSAAGHREGAHDATFVNLDEDPYGLVSRLLVHDRQQGGTLAEFSGMQGCGKTTALLALALFLASRGETVIWRGRDMDRWSSFPGEVRVFSDHPIAFAKIPDDADEPEPFDIPVHRFNGPEDLLAKVEKGALNVVYATEYEDDPDHVLGRGCKTRFWDRFVFAAIRRADVRWLALFIDEIHELWGDRPLDEDWHAQREVRNALADFRKAFCSLFVATHHYDETDDAILKKFQFHGYLRGARVPVWSVLRNKNKPSGLTPGRCILVSGNFAEVTLPHIPRPDYQLKVFPLPHDPDETPAGGGRGVNRMSAHARAPARARAREGTPMNLADLPITIDPAPPEESYTRKDRA